MAQWHIPLQIASYKGVRFDVISLDEDNSKSLVEHSYPYVDGADLEDMGLGTHNVRLSAIYWGVGFNSKIKHLLATLSKSGGGVLVHPVMGRIPDMVVDSYSVRYTAEDVNYVAIDMAFKKSTTASPIFIASNSLIAQIDQCFLALNDFLSFVSDLLSGSIGKVMLVASEASIFFRVVFEVFEVIAHQFDLPADLLPSFSALRDGSGLVSATHTVVNHSLHVDAINDDTSTLATITTGSTMINRHISDIDSINHSLESTLKTLPATVSRHLNEDKKQLIRQLFKSASTLALYQSAVNVIERDECLTPPEIEQINSDVREQIQATINSYRANSLLTDDAHYCIVERLRAHAHQFNKLTQSAINRKPPLVVKSAPFAGTLQQLSHHFYRDYRRADELTRLNPHIRHPAFVKQDEFINAYAK